MRLESDDLTYDTDIIHASDVQLSVPTSAGKRLQLLKGIDLVVASGESVAIIGRSGSGKTTLLTALGLMSKPDSGDLRICGVAANKVKDYQAAKLRNERIGFVFQNYSLVPHLSVIENVMLPFFYGAAISTRQAKASAMEALNRVGLDTLANARPGKLSGGEQQRVAIARALVRKPAVVLADEPTGALDTDTGELVIEILLEATAGTRSCLVLVTHDPQIASQMNRVLELKGGKLHSHVSGSPDVREALR